MFIVMWLGLLLFASTGLSADKSQYRNQTLWLGLEQSKLDALTQELASLPKQNVFIYCNNPTCHELAGDLENAFDSAQWGVHQEYPVIESMPTGIVCSDAHIGALIANITGLPVGPLDGWWLEGDTVGILIGKKPK